jgi:ATP-dependent DNA helicase RecG
LTRRRGALAARGALLKRGIGAPRVAVDHGSGAGPGVRRLLGLPGAGPVTARRLSAHGLVTVRDLLLRLPTAYDDLRRATPLVDVVAGVVADGAVVLVRGVVRRVHVFPRQVLDVVVEEGGAMVRARWFRPPPGLSKKYAKGADVALAGPLRTAADGTRELVHATNVTAALAARRADPRPGRGDAAEGLGLRARYASVEGVGARVLEGLVAAALAFVEAAPDAASLETLPAATCARLDLPTLGAALRAVHAPLATLGTDALEALRAGRTAAHRRLALEDLVAVQAAFLLRRARARAAGAPPPIALSEASGVAARVWDALGFAFTSAQARAFDDIARDLAAPRPMQRLLVGDVGSGKTAVAFAAAALVAAAGGQTLLMAPTEVLAGQHARALGPRAARLGFRLELLTAATPARARAALGADVAAGRVALVVGTQAVLDASLTFADLRLVVVDEQHRFGVAERARARRRGADAAAPLPHLLALSATPIPRTLALARHGDLDASVLDERPAGRRAPATLVCAGPDGRRAAYARLAEIVAAGRQAFVVCPVRERAQRSGAVTAVAHAASLRRELAPARVGLLHGALASADKEDVLRAFADGALDVLVATTVVELGIDVPNATLMIVEDAERFGLAQLHQLRGRVGRGAARGLCLLCPSAAAAAEGAARLATLVALDDGFRLAEADLAARGFGDLFGTRQTGAAGGLTDLREMFALVELARREAEAIAAADPTMAWPEHAPLARAAAELEGRRSLFDAEAG